MSNRNEAEVVEKLITEVVVFGNQDLDCLEDARKLARRLRATRTCYDCQHSLVCSLYKRIDDVIRDHVNWFDVDRSSLWQEMNVATATACTRYEMRP